MSDQKRQDQLHGRREVLQMGARGALGAMGATMLAGLGLQQGQRAWAAGPNSVVLTPEETEGPYFVEENLNRSDIRIDPTDKSIQTGHPLQLKINIVQLRNDALTPVTGAHIDIWHCNALGVYSDVPMQRSVGKKFLRGYQLSDKTGNVAFTTVYPGWYYGRAVHIHVKVRLVSGNKTNYEFTTQFFFDDKLTDKIYTQAPYNRREARDMRNTADNIYSEAPGGNTKGSKGALLTVKLADDASRAAGTFNIVLDPTRQHSRSFGRPGGFGPPPGGPGSFGPPPGGPGGFGPPPGGPGGFGPPPDGPDGFISKDVS